MHTLAYTLQTCMDTNLHKHTCTYMHVSTHIQTHTLKMPKAPTPPFPLPLSEAAPPPACAPHARPLLPATARTRTTAAPRTRARAFPVC